jgi:hypothetical protein
MEIRFGNKKHNQKETILFSCFFMIKRKVHFLNLLFQFKFEANSKNAYFRFE